MSFFLGHPVYIKFSQEIFQRENCLQKNSETSTSREIPGLELRILRQVKRATNRNNKVIFLWGSFLWRYFIEPIHIIQQVLNGVRNFQKKHAFCCACSYTFHITFDAVINCIRFNKTLDALILNH